MERKGHVLKWSPASVPPLEAQRTGDTWWGCACCPPVTSLWGLQTAWHFFKSAEDSLDILASSCLQ